MSITKDSTITNGDIPTAEHVDRDKGEIDDFVRRLSVSSTEDMDDAILKANGHEAVLQRQFKWISALGLGFSITNSWIGYLVRFNHFKADEVLAI